MSTNLPNLPNPTNLVNLVNLVNPAQFVALAGVWPG